MTKIEKNKMKKIVQEAFENEYGFAPALNKIDLLEYSGDENQITYIMVRVGNKEYQYHSTHINSFGVFVSGGITKLEA